MPRSSRATSIAVVARTTDSRAAVIEALEALGPLPDHVEGRRVCLAVGLGSAAFADPVVVDAAINWLVDQGIVEPTVIAVVPQRDRDVGWDAAALAKRHGYPPGLVADAWSSVEVADVDAGHVIRGRLVPQAWQNADLRIVLAPFATDAVEGHALTLDVLRHLPPVIAGAEPVDVVTDVLQTMPPDLSILDATVTSDGIAGTAIRHPLRTDTIVASTSAVLADVVGATLLGVDAMRSPLLASVVAVTGLPEDYRISGDLSAFAGVSYPPEALLRSTRAAGPSLGRVIGAALVDEYLAPDEDDIVLTYLRQQLRMCVPAASDAPAASSSLAWLTATGATLAGYIDAFKTTYAKDSVPRRVASIGLDLGGYAPRDYEAADITLRPLLQLVEGLTAEDGLRWTHLDGSVVFEASRTVAAPYRAWIERVDVSAAISMMADYLGGCVVVVARDKEGRPVRQAERNIYLAQPNYVSFSGGQSIDVCKLSVVRYRADSCEIWWRTVRSPNGSAIHDDGTVRFSDLGDGRTRVSVRGRQQFTLPPSLQAVDLDLQPELRDSLTDDAYRRFFSTTLDNFEACYEGRDFAIGQEPVDELPTVGLSRLVRLAGASVSDWLTSSAGDGSDVRVEAVDDAGFTHVAGARR